MVRSRSTRAHGRPVPCDHDDHGSGWTHARPIAIVARSSGRWIVDIPCVGPWIRSRPDRIRGPPSVIRQDSDPSAIRFRRRFIRCHIRIVVSTASIADRSSSSPQVSRSSIRSVASARHPSGVPRAAQPARFSATGPGGPRAREVARTTGTDSHRGVMAAAAAGIPTDGRARCSQRRVLIAARPHRCRSSRPGLVRSIAATAFRRVADDTRPRGRVSPRTAPSLDATPSGGGHRR